MGMMTTAPLCQLLSFTIWFHKMNWVSALNGCLVSVGPAGSGSEEHGHPESALLLGGGTLLRAAARHGSASYFASLARSCSSVSNYVLSIKGPLDHDQTRVLLLPNRSELLFHLPGWAAWCNPQSLGAGPPNLFLHIHFIISTFLFALPFQVAGGAEMLLLPREGQVELPLVPLAGGVGPSRYCGRRREHGTRRRLKLCGKEQSSHIAGKERESDWKKKKKEGRR